MKIAIDVSILSGPMRGPGRYLLNLLFTLSKVDRKNNYLLYGYAHSDKKVISMLSSLTPNFELYFKKIPGRLIHGLYRLPIPWDIFLPGVDIIHFPDPFDIPWVKVPSIITLPDIIPLLWPEFFPFYGKKLHKNLPKLKKVKAIITSSRWSKEKIINHLKIEPSLIKVIPLGIDKSSFFPIPKEEARRKVSQKFNINHPFLLWVGVPEPRKNLDVLTKAFLLFQKKFPQYKLVLVGLTQFPYPHKKKGNKIIPLGHISDENLHLLYSAAEVFVFPSLYEGFGLPPLEAMACGTPVVTSNTSSLPEVVGDAALRVDPHKVEELVEAIFKVIGEERVRKTLVKKGLERVKKFSWEKCALETLQVYEEVYQGRG